MFTSSHILSILSLASFIDASPVDVQEKRQEAPADKVSPCYNYKNGGCLRSSWTIGPECKTNHLLVSSQYTLMHPPASETSTYTPLQWCSSLLHQTDWTTTTKTIQKASPSTSWIILTSTLTKTDLDHPTSTVYCPSPSPSAECGYDIYAMACAWTGCTISLRNPFLNLTECQQACLDHPECKSYRVDPEVDCAPCGLFTQALGEGASNALAPTKGGTMAYDRNCQQHMPTGCAKVENQRVEVRDSPVTKAQEMATATTATTATTVVSPKRTLVSEVAKRELIKDEISIPPFISRMLYPFHTNYLTSVCSCLISSELPPVRGTATSVITEWTSTTIFIPTYTNTVVDYTTPRVTTVTASVN